MIIAVHNHQGKANMLVAALEAAGHTIVPRQYTPAQALLIDLDIPMAYYERVIEKQVIAGAKVILYQHGGPVVYGYDGIYPASDRTSAFLSLSKGSKAVMEKFGYPNPIHVIGWYYCERKEYAPATEYKNILFAPWHPLQSGYLHPERRTKNVQVFKDLQEIPDINLTVRMIGSDLENGIELVDGVEYVQGRPDNSIADIDAADLVISPVGTFPLLSLARGTPAIMYGQDIWPMDGDTDRGIQRVLSWDRYQEQMYYPYHWPDKPLLDLMADTRKEPEWYISQFIGPEFDPGEFVELFESLVMQDERVMA